MADSTGSAGDIVKTIAGDVSATVAAVEAVEAILDQMTRSVNIEVDNLTSRTLVVKLTEHSHGGFKKPPDGQATHLVTMSSVQGVQDFSLVPKVV
jgi:hypothetical protein